MALKSCAERNVLGALVNVKKIASVIVAVVEVLSKELADTVNKEKEGTASG